MKQFLKDCWKEFFGPLLWAALLSGWLLVIILSGAFLLFLWWLSPGLVRIAGDLLFVLSGGA